MIRGIRVRLNDSTMGSIMFQYEKLPTFCYICGVVGHGEKDCGGDREDSKEGKKNVVGG